MTKRMQSYEQGNPMRDKKLQIIHDEIWQKIYERQKRPLQYEAEKERRSIDPQTDKIMFTDPIRACTTDPQTTEL